MPPPFSNNFVKIFLHMLCKAPHSGVHNIKRKFFRGAYGAVIANASACNGFFPLDFSIPVPETLLYNAHHFFGSERLGDAGAHHVVLTGAFHVLFVA